MFLTLLPQPSCVRALWSESTLRAEGLTIAHRSSDVAGRYLLSEAKWQHFISGEERRRESVKHEVTFPHKTSHLTSKRVLFQEGGQRLMRYYNYLL